MTQPIKKPIPAPVKKPAPAPAPKPAPAPVPPVEEFDEDGNPIVPAPAQPTDKMLLKRLAEKDAEIARIKASTVPVEQYNELVEGIADGAYNPAEDDEEEAPEPTMDETVEGLFAIGSKSIRNRVGNREAIQRQVDATYRIRKAQGRCPLVIKGSPIDSRAKADEWLQFMEAALAAGPTEDTFNLWVKQHTSREA